ncbi:MAG: energy-coupling factor ABC transporter ATP-binding protein, partial [Anaerolineales bacterium]
PQIVSNLDKADDQQEVTSLKSSILEISDLSTRMAGQRILKQINFKLFKGEILILIGPNGAGKTTLLRSILGLVPSEGQIKMIGKDTHGMDLSEIIQYGAYLPQNPNDLLFAESVRDELHTTLKNHGIRKNDSEITTFLTKFGLEKQLDQYPRDLSVGERQKTALAAISVHQPIILLLDEPTRGLDYETKKGLINLLKVWSEEGRSILLVTQDIEFAAQIADRVAILEEGEIVYLGDPKIGFSKFPAYQTQVSRLFPHSSCIILEDIIS